MRPAIKKKRLIPEMYRKFIWAGEALLAIIIIGTAGYRIIGGKEHSLLDYFYMTFITISTIGYGEIIDLSDNPAGRVFTVLIALSGIAVLFYILTNFTAFIVEGEMSEAFRRKKMEKMAGKLSDHYIVCGIGKVGQNIIEEMQATKRPFVAIDSGKGDLEGYIESIQDLIFLEEDATDNDTLLKAGIMRARGLFAVTGDDNQNLVITLTAKQLNPQIRVVSRCNDIRNTEKMRKAGADAVVSPSLIGGLRMASEIIRPAVVSFLDILPWTTG